MGCSKYTFFLSSFVPIYLFLPGVQQFLLYGKWKLLDVHFSKKHLRIVNQNLFFHECLSDLAQFNSYMNKVKVSFNFSHYACNRNLGERSMSFPNFDKGNWLVPAVMTDSFCSVMYKTACKIVDLYWAPFAKRSIR